ncbi:putative titin-like [Apostichopus japonicus]|uniref:Putative titin-like n=1 Tax=Stichopus japonicus TaxID=307972 RepID=A0A2G8LL17_STIJA|nr:putative titin-like [Apostichopus japonicus]
MLLSILEETATFTCRVIGFPRPTITWLINGNPLSDDRFISVYELDGICTLVITEVIEEDDTVYELVATNEAGTVTTEAELIIPVDEKSNVAMNQYPQEVQITFEVPEKQPITVELPEEKPTEQIPQMTEDVRETIEAVIEEKPHMALREAQITFAVPEEQPIEVNATEVYPDDKHVEEVPKKLEDVRETIEVVIKEKPEAPQEVQITLGVLGEHPIEEMPQMDIQKRYLSKKPLKNQNMLRRQLKLSWKKT